MGNENINDFLAEEYKIEKLREEGIKPSYKTNTQGKIYIGTNGLFQSDGLLKDYNERAARTDEIKELNKMVSQ